MLRVLFAQYCMFGRYLPVNTQATVKNAYAAVRFWMIELVAFVLEHRRFAQHGKTVCKAFWDEKLPVVILSQLHSHVLAVGGRAFPDINRNVKHTATNAPYKFCLCIRRTLEMQPTHDTIR